MKHTSENDDTVWETATKSYFAVTSHRRITVLVKLCRL
jgi:hypothetical protein